MVTAVVLATLAALSVSNDSRLTQAAHPGQNGRIAFAVQDGANRHIWTMESDGSDRRQITTGDVTDFGPRYSPDGTKIAFRRNTPSGGIFVVDAADGSNLHFVPGTDQGYGPSWSPDAQRIAFLNDLPDQVDIFTVGINGDDPTNLTNSENANEVSPDWSPDGQRIAFIRFSQVDGTDLWTMDTAGLNRAKLTTSPVVQEDLPDWSPDSTRIVFEVYDSATNQSDIAIVSALGGVVTPLANSAEEEDWPTFSPDGEKIAYSMRVELTVQGADPDGAAIHIMNADGSDKHNISLVDPPRDETPDWGIIPGTGPTTRIWGDNDCSGAVTEYDALFPALVSLQLAAEIGAPCPAIGQTINVEGPQVLIWASVDCSGAVDGSDIVTLLRHFAGLDALIPECPPIEAPVLQLPG
jgi:hypothetical protein